MYQYKFYLLIFILCLVIPYCEPASYQIKSNDSVLFLGGINTMMGSTLPHGFVNLFRNEISKTLANVSIANAANRRANSADLLRSLDLILVGKNIPTKAILTFGIEVLEIETLSQLRFETESIVARLLQDGVEVILCPMVVNGERLDDTNEKDDILFEFNGMMKHIVRDYDVMYINLAPQIEQFLLKNNVDKLPHSVLTVDGDILNETGHTFVALALLRGFGITDHSLISDNVVLREELRVHKLKQEMDRIGALGEVFVNSRGV